MGLLQLHSLGAEGMTWRGPKELGRVPFTFMSHSQSHLHLLLVSVISPLILSNYLERTIFNFASFPYFISFSEYCHLYTSITSPLFGIVPFQDSPPSKPLDTIDLLIRCYIWHPAVCCHQGTHLNPLFPKYLCPSHGFHESLIFLFLCWQSQG